MIGAVSLTGRSQALGVLAERRLRRFAKPRGGHPPKVRILHTPPCRQADPHPPRFRGFVQSPGWKVLTLQTQVQSLHPLPRADSVQLRLRRVTAFA